VLSEFSIAPFAFDAYFVTDATNQFSRIGNKFDRANTFPRISSE